MNQQKPKRILIVDDNEAGAECIRGYLERYDNTTCDIATSPEDAAALLENQYDVIAADFNLQTALNGANVISKFKQSRPGIKTLLYSRAKLDDDTAGFGVDALLQNEVDPARIVDKIKRLCVADMGFEEREMLHESIGSTHAKLAHLEQKIDKFIDSTTTQFSEVQKIAQEAMCKKAECVWKIVGFTVTINGAIIGIALLVCTYFANDVKKVVQTFDDRLTVCERITHGIIPSVSAGTLPNSYQQVNPKAQQK